MNFDSILKMMCVKLNIKQKKLANNINLKEISRGKRAFLIATGPSIKKQDLSLLKNEDCFSISNFFLHDKIDIICPKIHFIAPYHKPLDYDNIVSVWKMANKMLPKDTIIGLSIASKDMIEINHIFDGRKIYYFDYEPLKRINIDLEKAVLSPQSGPIMALPILFYMGYTEIYLIGCDGNMLKDYGKTIENFYEKDPRKNASDDWHDGNIISELECNLNLMKQYKAYYDYGKKIGVNLYNLSPDSWIDIIPLRKFEDVLGE